MSHSFLSADFWGYGLTFSLRKEKVSKKKRSVVSHSFLSADFWGYGLTFSLRKEKVSKKKRFVVPRGLSGQKNLPIRKVFGIFKVIFLKIILNRGLGRKPQHSLTPKGLKSK
ncbi:MAG: hypothetical protein IJ489_06675 [Clostridia bacterium]|nr:hypothetical protein [Clostridia bacterium]